MRNPKVMDGIRIAAGVYLIYLACQILRDGVIGGGMTGASYTAGIIFSIVFLVGGAGIAIWSVRNMVRANRSEKTENSAAEQADLSEGKTEENAPEQIEGTTDRSEK